MKTSNPFSILIVKTSAIGDVIQSFPVLEYLRKRCPKARIDWVVEEQIASLLRAHPLLDQVIEIQTKLWRKNPFSKKTRNEFSCFVRHLRSVTYDLVIDLQGNAKSAIVTRSAKAKVKLGFGAESVREKINLLATNKRLNISPYLGVRKKYLSLVQGYFNDNEPFEAQGVQLKITQAEQKRLEEIAHASSKGIAQVAILEKKQGQDREKIADFERIKPEVQVTINQPELMVCFGSKWANKRLDPSILKVFLHKVSKEYPFSFLFIFGNEEEKCIAEDLATSFKERGKVIGNLSLPLWQALMWQVKGVIAVDSAALHLCGTTHTPSFSIFGPTSAHLFKPIEERHFALQAPCPYGRSFVSQCSVLRSCPTGACMRQLNIEHLFSSFKHWSESVLNLR